MATDETYTTSEAGSDETHEAGRATGDDHVFGTLTVDGTKTNDEVLTETIYDDGTV
jgi:hypothetical protein